MMRVPFFLLFGFNKGTQKENGQKGTTGEPRSGVRIRGTLRDIDPHNMVPFKRARSRVKKGPL